VNGWKSLYSYMGFLIDARAPIETHVKLYGFFGPFHRSVLVARFYLRNRVLRMKNERRLAAVRAACLPGAGDPEPLVSIVMPTHNRCALLMERSLRSALDQSYPNIEIVVVGDRCTDDTELEVRGLGLDNVKFVELPPTTGSPGQGFDAWLVAGIDPSNLGVRMSSGDWIVHLDDDDELATGHVEAMVRFAIENGLEMAYPKAVVVAGDGNRTEIGSFPPALGKMPHSGAMFSARLKFLTYDRKGYRFLEPGDWNLWRRMKEAGVRMGFLDRPLVFIYPAGPSSY
jgi:glycosyltransferase involved in cell wall biosynthesis